MALGTEQLCIKCEKPDNKINIESEIQNFSKIKKIRRIVDKNSGKASHLIFYFHSLKDVQ